MLDEKLLVTYTINPQLERQLIAFINGKNNKFFLLSKNLFRLEMKGSIYTCIFFFFANPHISIGI